MQVVNTKNRLFTIGLEQTKILPWKIPLILIQFTFVSGVHCALCAGMAAACAVKSIQTIIKMRWIMNSKKYVTKKR